MIWSFKSFQWSELGNIFSTLWSEPKLLPINLGGKFCMRHMIGLDVRKISWEKEIPLHTIKCYSFKEVSFWKKKNPVCYFTFNVMLSPLGFLHSAFCFLVLMLKMKFSKEKKENKNTNKFLKIADKNTNKCLNLKQHMLSMSDMLFAWGSSYVKKTSEVRWYRFSIFHITELTKLQIPISLTC